MLPVPALGFCCSFATSPSLPLCVSSCYKAHSLDAFSSRKSSPTFSASHPQLALTILPRCRLCRVSCSQSESDNRRDCPPSEIWNHSSGKPLWSYQLCNFRREQPPRLKSPDPLYRESLPTLKRSSRPPRFHWHFQM